MTRWLDNEAWRRRAVIAVWALSTLAALGLVVSFGTDAPFADEWPWSEVVSGAQPLTAQWLLQPENQHRVPLGKLLYLGLNWLGGCDFRSAAVGNVAVLSLAAWALIGAIRRAQGTTRWSDVLIPVALLHLGHYYNLIWGHQIFFSASTAVMCGWLCLIMPRGAQWSLRDALLAALACVLLAGCGGSGICSVPAIALWLGYRSVEAWRSAGPAGRRRAGVSLALALACLALVPLYFWGNSSTEPAPKTTLDVERIGLALRGAVQVLAVSIGRLGRDLWPVSGAIIVVVVLAACARAARTAFRGSLERCRAIGLLCFLLALATTALGIGWSRGTLGDAYCLTARYTTLLCPLVVGAYAVFALYGPGLRLQWADAACAALFVSIGLGYISTGMHQAADIQVRLARMEALAREGFSPRAIAMRTSADVQDVEADLAGRLAQLRRARIGPYRHVAADEETLEATVVPLTGQSTAVDASSAVELRAGQTWRQPLSLRDGTEIFRIDVRVRAKLRRTPLPASLDWKLLEHDPSGSTAVKAAGRCPLDRLQDPMFAQLRFAPVTVVEHARYELVLSAVEAPSQRTLTIPLFASDVAKGTRDLQGFVYSTLSPPHVAGPQPSAARR